MNYKILEEITVKSQEELDNIPLDYKGRIYIEFGTYFDKAVVRNKYFQSVVAMENSSVVAWENSSVEAMENSSVEARGNSSVEARGNSSVVAMENSSVVAMENSSVEAMENSSVVAMENSSVEAMENSSVVAWENSSVEARENSSVIARGNSSVEARENSSVIARGNSSVVAWENSSVVAWENSSVEAMENSSVIARGNSSVEATGNVQVCDRSYGNIIKIFGNARIVYMPKNIKEFMDFYNIKYTKTKAIFYKAVRKINNEYVSDYDNKFKYEIGKVKKEKCDEDIDTACSYGINISNLNWALNYGRNWDNIAILEVETKIKNIVMPTDTDGKVRTSEIKVIREVPLEECGIYGKILTNRRKNDNK